MIDEYSNYNQQGDNNSKNKLEKIILQTYQKVKYVALDGLKRPFIFAYSAFVNDETFKRTNECGFDGCLHSPLTIDVVKDLIGNYVEKFV